jgi:hypothetical protein
MREVLSKWVLQSSASSLNTSHCTKLNWLYLASTWSNCSPLLQVTESFSVLCDVVKPLWHHGGVGFVIASGANLQMTFNPLNSHSRFKCSVSEKNNIYDIFRAWGSSVLKQGTGWASRVLFQAGTTQFLPFHSVQTVSGSNPTPDTIHTEQWWLCPLSLHHIVLN